MGNNKKKISPIDQKPLRRAGLSLWQKISRQTLVVDAVVFAPLAILSGILLGIALTSILNGIWALVVIVPFIPIWMIFGGAYVKKATVHLENLQLGLEGEIFVGEELDSLKEKGCKIIHDFSDTHRKGKSNIDHIVIAPQGVFTVETKVVSKIDDKNEQIIYDGQKVRISSGRQLDNPLDQAEAEAKELKNFIYKHLRDDIFVQPIVVYPRWWVDVVRNSNNFRRVIVCNHHFFAKHIPTMPVVLSEKQIHIIYETLAEHNRIS